MGKKEIAILMATYNGESFLGEQIESILSQTYHEWHLYIHDDGSTDNTISIAEDYQRRYTDKITLLIYPSQGSAGKNFISMMERVDAEYYMFCDQDDVWLPEKINTSVTAMKQQEGVHIGKPIIICTDLYLTDKDLIITYQSRNRFSSLYPQYIKTFDDCAPTAGVTGCTMFFNNAAKNSCLSPLPEDTLHDCWLLLCTLKKRGILHYIDRPLVYYRQHGNNTLGASVNTMNIGIVYRISHLRRIFRNHYKQYLLLRRLNYGSCFKYVRHVLKYRKRISQGFYLLILVLLHILRV